jgi:hypothetical protein
VVRWGTVESPIERRAMDTWKFGYLGHGFAGLLDELASVCNLPSLFIADNAVQVAGAGTKDYAQVCQTGNVSLKAASPF